MKKILYHIFLLLCIAVFCISAYKLYGYYKSYKEAKDTYEKIKKDNVKKTNGDRTIDFDKLRAKNPDIVGWVYAKGTGIDYPIVQGKDNEEYLHMDYNKKKSSSGTIFLDYGCDKSFISDNNIIYGHHMKNGTMFAKLLKFREESFLKKHHVIILYTPKKTMHLKVISAYAVKAQDQMPITFANETQKKEYITKIRRMSEPSIKLDDKKIDRIYTFMTCSYERDDNRTYVHVEKEYEDIKVRSNKIRIGGLYEYAFAVDGAGNMVKKSIPSKVRDFLMDYENTDAFKIMLSHRPDSFVFGQAADTWKIDLVVSGHVHGGQVRIPGKGGLYGGDQGWFPEYADGIHHFKAVNHMIITRGLGSDKEKLPRFHNIPEVVVIRLEKR